MTAYSRVDIEEAFDCAAEGDETSIAPGVCREKVLHHLDGNCSCDRNRCRHCRRRPHNRLPNHESGCPMALGKA